MVDQWGQHVAAVVRPLSHLKVLKQFGAKIAVSNVPARWAGKV